MVNHHMNSWIHIHNVNTEDLVYYRWITLRSSVSVSVTTEVHLDNMKYSVTFLFLYNFVQICTAIF